jgi:5-methylcytosine-specific restriction enzyme subunit McrC
MAHSTSLRTYALTERIGRECRLTPADVDFLLAEHRPHIELAPTGRRGHYQLTPAGHVGTIVCPTCRLVIRPKIPVQNLFHLLDPTADVPVEEDRTDPELETEALDFLAGCLARLLAECAAAGLHHGYIERAEQGPFLQGRLDLTAQLRAEHKDRFHCRFEEFTADVPCNQVPKATAELVLRSPLIGDGVRTALRRVLEAFASVTSIALGPDSFAGARPDRLTEAYRPLLDVCRLLADGLGAGRQAGPTHCPAFLLDMERVFERYVTKGVVRATGTGGRYEVTVQPLHLASPAMSGQPDFQVRPDIVLHRAGRAVAIIDAKWKVLSGSPLVTTDVYQVLAYATALGVRRAILVYPGRRNRLWHYPLAHSPLKLEIRTLRVTGARAVCQRSLSRFGQALTARPRKPA